MANDKIRTDTLLNIIRAIDVIGEDKVNELINGYYQRKQTNDVLKTEKHIVNITTSLYGITVDNLRAVQNETSYEFKMVISYLFDKYCKYKQYDIAFKLGLTSQSSISRMLEKAKSLNPNFKPDKAILDNIELLENKII